METVKVRNLAEPVFSKVNEIQPGKSGYNLYLKIVSKTVLTDRKRIDSSRVVICDFVVHTVQESVCKLWNVIAYFSKTNNKLALDNFYRVFSYD